MPDDAKQIVLRQLGELREALANEPLDDAVTNARHQCERLEHALVLSHAEGIRFAAYSLMKLLDPARAPRSAAVLRAYGKLKDALEAGRFPH